MRSFTMKNFDYFKAWKQRFDVDVVEGDEIIVDNESEYKITKVIMPKDEDKDVFSPHYVLTPIKETLKEEMRLHNESAKNNPSLLKIGEYPDFSFEVESLWFFSRNVKIK